MVETVVIISIPLISVIEVAILFFIKRRMSFFFLIFLSFLAIISFAILSNSILLFLLFLFFSIYRIFNLLRGIKKYSQSLLSTILNSSIRLNILLLVLVLLQYNNVSSYLFITKSLIVYLSIIIVCLILINIFSRLNISAAKHTHKPIHYYDKDLPTISVLIPARNETDDLESCLASLVRSDYPKLEIIVLDDCSLSKKTSQIIKNFAHNGVRFLQGETPDNDWLPKNYAYEQLAGQANGEIILFCGVDVRFESHTIRSLVDIFKTENYSMISVIPKNSYNKADSGSLFYQPLRYAFEVSLPRYRLNRPPVLSTCWMIDKKNFIKLGSFKSIRHKVSPESYFSRQILLSKQKYKLLKSDRSIGLESYKSSYEQSQTAIRTYYPKLHRRLDLVSILTLFEFFLFVLPTFSFILAIVLIDTPMLILASVAIILQVYYYNQLINLTFDHKIIRYRFLVLFAFMLDIYLYNKSMFLYEFRQVYWKERNICLPVLNYRLNQPSIDSEQKY